MTEQIDIGNHVLCINRSVEQKLGNALEIVKAGLNNNEDVLLLFEDLTKDEIVNYIKAKWKDVQDHVDNGDITIMRSSQWYLPDASFDTSKIMSRWSTAVANACKKGKKGLRAFADVHSLFAGGLGDKLLDYESLLGEKFSSAFVVVCAYEAGDIDSLSPKRFAKLREQHDLVLSDDYQHQYKQAKPIGKILVVDDEGDISSIVKKFLEAKKFVVDSFTNPLEALEHFKQFPKEYSLIISDIRMPGMTGLELGKEIKKLSPEIKLMFMSAFEINSSEFSQISPSTMKDAFIQKPAKLSELYTKVTRQLDQGEDWR